ncbi:MAG: hypothetical protein KJ011_06570 [Burkholderiaceae bacterium]|nr:hypothetical protein [Burkholderiaceae bacterium]
MEATREIPLNRDQLIEARRRLRIDVATLESEIFAAERVEGLRRLYGDKIGPSEADVPALRAALAGAEAQIVDIDKQINDLDAEQADREAAALRRRAEEIEAADTRLLAARMANDRAVASRLQAAVVGDPKAYAKACVASDAARDAFERAQQAREWLED